MRTGANRRVSSRAVRKGGVPLGKKLAKKLPLLLFIVAAVAVVVAVPFAARAAYRYVSSFPAFEMKDVKVDGLRYVSSEDFLKYIGDPRGGSIVHYDRESVLKKALAHPWIKSVVIRRDFPNTLRIEVVERRPAMLAESGSGRYLVDDDGYAITKVTGPGWEFLPVIQCPRARDFKLLDQEAAKEFREAMALMSIIKSEQSEKLTGAGVILGDDRLPCMVLGGTVVKLGRGGYTEKVRRLVEVADDIRKRGSNPSVIDLRFPGKVVVKDGQTGTASAAPGGQGGG